MTPERHADGVGVPQLILSGRWTPPATLLVEVWQARELCWTLARKEFFVRYRRATFGVLWAVALPAVQAAVLSLVLTRVTRIHVPHYSSFIFSGIVGWTYFATTLGSGATSIVDNASLSSKIYFPRAVIPIAVCISGLFTLLVSIVVLLVVELIAGIPVGLHLLLLVPAFLLAALLTTALTLTLSAAQVYLRDVKYAVQTGLLVWFYVTPVFYPLQVLHGVFKTLVLINPVTGVVQLFHLAALGSAADTGLAVASTAAWIVALVVIGMWLHCRYDRFLADLL